VAPSDVLGPAPRPGGGGRTTRGAAGRRGGGGGGAEGRIEYSQTEDEQGQPRYWTDIVVRDMVMLGSGSGSPSGPYGESSRPARGTRQPVPPVSPFDDEDDDLPF